MIDYQSNTAHKTATIRQLRRYATDRMAISTQEGMVIIRFADISYCEAMSNYCRIHLGDGRSVMASKPMKKIMAALPGGEFFRPHQTYVVRIDAIVSAGTDIRLEGGQIIPVSRAHKASLNQLLHSLMQVI